MAVEVPSLNDVKNQGTNNVTPAIVGGGSIILGSAVMGGTLGPLVGGTVAGAAVGGDAGKMITLFGMLQGITNVTNGGGSGGRRSRPAAK